MRFADIAGQENVKTFLRNEADGGRQAHARLLVGKEGVGKLALAIAFAQYSNCRQRAQGDSCGVCPSCVKFQKLTHPDLHFVFPMVRKSSSKDTSDTFVGEWREYLSETVYPSMDGWLTKLKLDNKQGTIYSDESNAIIRKMGMKNWEAAYKFVIIWNADKMQPAGANKLLKVLEEPPANTVFMLLTENAENILPTIYSRTQLLKVPNIENQSLLKYLSEKCGEELAREVLPLAGGSVTEALKLVKEKDSLHYNFDAFTNLMRHCYARDVPALYDWTEEIAKLGREKQKQLLDYAGRMVRENFMYNFKEEKLYGLTATEQGFSKKFSPFVNTANVEELYEHFNKAHYDISRNGNAKVVFMDLCIQIIRKIRA